MSKAPGQPLEMVEVEVAPPRAHEVRVKIVCTSLCHTDLTFWRMKVPDANNNPRQPSVDYLSFLGCKIRGPGEINKIQKKSTLKFFGLPSEFIALLLKSLLLMQ